MSQHIHIEKITVSEFDKNTWDSFVSYPVQSFAWVESRNVLEKKIDACGVYVGNVLVDVFLCSIDALPFSGYRATILKGKLYTDEIYEAFLEYAKTEDIKFFVFEPDIFFESGIVVPAILKKYTSMQFAQWTALIDLSLPIESIESAFSKTVRNESRRAVHDGIVVSNGVDTQDFENFIQIMDLTKKRNNFHGYSTDYYRAVFASLKRYNQVQIFSVHSSGGQLVATAFVFIFKKTLYYAYAGSLGNETPKGAMYLLVRTIIEYGKEHHFDTLDLFGTLDPDYVGSNHPWKGFTQFKKSFGPQFKKYVGAYVLVVSPVVFKLFMIAVSIKSRLTFVLKKVR